MEEIIQYLNSEQKKAVLQIDGPLLILAGAGSGKTRVITCRIANLILNHKIDRICAVTFTNKAAKEIKERVLSMVPSLSFFTQIRTFHSLCLVILRNESVNLGFDSAFTIYDSDTQKSLLKQVIKDFNLNPKEIKPEKIANHIQRSKDSDVKIKDYIQDLKDSFFAEHFFAIYQEYEKRKIQNHAFDFGDLIVKTIELFTNQPSILEKYQDYWKYLMIDEYQDTNPIQYKLIKMLAAKYKNLCVVGDDDQSIYSWRGARVSNILDFEQDYPNTLVIHLEENYRSSKNIIRVASAIIKHNYKRKKKNIFTNNQEGSLVNLFLYDCESAEANAIFKKIQEIYQEKKEYKNIAIFYRTNAQSRILEESCRKLNIPYKIFGGFKFFDRAEVKDLLSYLNLIVNPNDDMSLLRIINTPARGIGEKTIEKIRAKSQEKELSLFAVLNHSDLDIKKIAKEKILDLYHTLSEIMEKNKKRKLLPSDIAIEIIEQVGLHSAYDKEGEKEFNARVDNLRELIRSIEQYEMNVSEPSLESYLNEVILLTSEEGTKEVDDYVNLMTVHSSKGLEFETVFLISLVEGIFPHMFSVGTDEIEEERRLFYVAVTRAKKNLFLSYIKYSTKFGSQEFKTASRFIAEIRPEWLKSDFNMPKINMPKKKISFQKQGSFQLKQSYKIGERVRHKTYGVGKIIFISGSGENQKATIQFGQIEKKFFLTYTPLEKIS